MVLYALPSSSSRGLEALHTPMVLLALLRDLLPPVVKPAKPNLFGVMGIYMSRWLFRYLKFQSLSTGDDLSIVVE